MGTLYVVATPIGNLRDLTTRAEETFGAVSVVLCEDTRVTGKLLHHLGIKRELVALHQHTERSSMKTLIERLRAGESMALVTDAGTPGISDPGGIFIEELVRLAPEIVITPIPGANAIAAALSVSGVPADVYTFFGFPPHKKAREKFFDTLTSTEHTGVFYESTHRIEKALTQIGERQKDRQLIVCRELTKLHETIYRGTAHQILAALQATSTKGEFVVVLAPIGF